MEDIINNNKYNCSIINFTAISNRSIINANSLTHSLNINDQLIIDKFYYHCAVLDLLGVIRNNPCASNIIIYIDTCYCDPRALTLSKFMPTRHIAMRLNFDKFTSKIDSQDAKVVGKIESVVSRTRNIQSKLKKFKKFISNQGLTSLEEVIKEDKTSVMFLCK
jgi:hypothetical protein